MKNIEGTQTNSYRLRTVPGSFAPSASYTGQTILINNSSGVTQTYELELTQTYTPTDTDFQPQSIVTTNQFTIDPTTQLAFSPTPVTSPTTFASGGFVIQEAFTETPSRPAGTLQGLLMYRFVDNTGTPGLSGTLSVTEISTDLFQTPTITASTLYASAGGLYGSIQVIGVSGAIGGTSVSNFDGTIKTITGCWGPSVLAPTLTIGTETIAASSYFDSFNFVNQYTWLVSVTAGGMDHSQMQMTVTTHWNGFSFIDFTTHDSVDSTTIPWISGSLWRGYSNFSPQNFGSWSSRKVGIKCTVDDNFGSSAILPVSCPEISASY